MRNEIFGNFLKCKNVLKYILFLVITIDMLAKHVDGWMRLQTGQAVNLANVL